MPENKHKYKELNCRKQNYPNFNKNESINDILKKIKLVTSKGQRHPKTEVITTDLLYQKLAKILVDCINEVKHVRIILKKNLKKPDDKYKIVDKQFSEDEEIGLGTEDLKKQEKVFTVKHIRMLVKKELMKKLEAREEEDDALEEYVEEMEEKVNENPEKQDEEESLKVEKPDDVKVKGEILFRVLDQILLNKIQTRVGGRSSVQKRYLMIKKRINLPTTEQLLKRKKLKHKQDQKFKKLIKYIRQTMIKLKSDERSYKKMRNFLRLIIKLNLKHIFSLNLIKDKNRLRHIKAVKFIRDRKAINQTLEIEYFKRILSKLLQKMAKVNKNMRKLNERKEILTKSSKWVCKDGKYRNRNKKRWNMVKSLEKEINEDTGTMVHDIENLFKKYEHELEDIEITRQKSRKSVRFKLPKKYDSFSWKESIRTHATKIEKLKNKECIQIFGETNVALLIEHAYASITIFYKETIVGFIAVNDYPNINCLIAENWKSWFKNHCGIKNFTTTNTLFIHLVVWKDHFEHMIMQTLLLPIFVLNGFLKNLVILPPPFVELMENKFFRNYFKCLKSEKNPLMRVFFTTRSTNIAKWNFKPLDANDCSVLNKMFKETAPELIDIYGENVVSQIIVAKSPHRKMFLIMENDAEEDTIGFISYSDEIDYNTLKDNFEICDYNGFRLPTEYDMRYDDGLLENTANLNDTEVRGTLRMLNKKLICEMNLKVDEINKIDFNIKPIPEQLCEFASIPDIHLTSEGIPETEDVFFEINENKFMEFITFKTLCLIADSQGNKMLRQTPYKIEPNLQYFKGRKNAFSIEIMFPTHNMDNMLFINYIIQGFKAFDDLEFLVISTPRGVYSNPIFQYLNRLERTTVTFPNEVFAAHKTVFFWEFYVRKATEDDLEDIISMTIYFDNYETLQDELFSIMKNQHPQSGQTVIMLMAQDKVVGLALVFQELDTEFLRYYYDLENLMNFNLHKADEHGVVKYFILNELYRIRTRHYLREIMRMMSFTSLYCYKFPPTSKVYNSIVLGLEYWVPVRPRLIPDYWACTDQVSKYYQQDKQAFSLFYLSYKIASKSKEFFYERIVIVGSGELGLSFLENLIFNQNAATKSVYDITFVTKSGIPRKGMISDLIESINPFNGRFNAHYIDKIPIFSLVKYVQGEMIEIKRKEKIITVIDFADNTPKFIEYDYLFLFCGEQYADPRGELSGSIHGCNIFYDDRSTYENKFLNRPENLYTINSYGEAYKLLADLMLRRKEDDHEGKIIIYGRTIDALSFISLLKLKESFMMDVVLVQPHLNSDVINCIQNEEIYNEAMKSLKETDVEIYSEYNFKQWTVNNGRIEEAHFQSTSKFIMIPCDIFVSFHPKIIFYKTLLALIDSGLAFNGKLAIHNNFRTSDDHIYAGGSFTMYYKRHARHYNHKYYNSAEIGAEIAMQFVKHLTLFNVKRNNKGNSDLNEKPENIIIDFTQPCIQYGSFPTGWNYLNISKPNARLHTEISFRTLKNVLVLETGNFNIEQGYFRIVLDENHLVEDIICLTKNGIPYNNYFQLFGKHERLLNNLLIRYHANKIKHFYEYFNEGWAFAIYHDRFITLENKIHHIFYVGRRTSAHKMRSCDVKGCIKKHYFIKKKEHNSSVTEAILLLMRLNYWEKIPLEFQECLDVLINVLSRKRTILEDAILTFLDDNKNHLTMFTSPTSLLEMYQGQQNSHILENADRHLGAKPLFTEQPEYVNVEQKEMKLNKYVNEELYLEKKKIQMDEIIKKRIVRQFFRMQSKQIPK